MAKHRWSWKLDTTLPSRSGAHLACMKQILTELTQLGWEGRDFFAVEVSLEETLSNAIRHGNQFDESKQVFVACKASPERFWLKVCDEGPGFDPDAVPDCTDEKHLEECGGRGVMLIQAYMTRVEYNEAGNCVTMEKVRGGEDAGD